MDDGKFERESLRQQEIEMTVKEAENKKLARRSSAFLSLN